jgi:proteic killer suppression protein
MIKSYRDAETERIARGGYSRRFPATIQKRARLCIERIHSARHPADLRFFPGMRLKKLKGELRDIYSVRVNDQYRVCFEWVSGSVVNVELVDYH